MAFDLATAKPEGGFDLATAKPEDAKRRSPKEMIGRQIGLTARAALEGNPISAVSGILGQAMGLVGG